MGERLSRWRVHAAFFLIRSAGAGRVVAALASSTVPLNVSALMVLMREREAQETTQMYSAMILGSIAKGLGARNLPDVFEEVQKVRRGGANNNPEDNAHVLSAAERGIFQFLE